MDEETLELAAAAWFESIRVRVVHARDLQHESYDVSTPILKTVLSSALRRLNPDVSEAAIVDVVRMLSAPPNPTLIQNNQWFHALVTGGVDVEFRDPSVGEIRGMRARLVDFTHPRQNDFLLVRQLSVVGENGRVIRPDLTLFMNGFPVAVLELKDPTQARATLTTAVEQLHRYVHTAPEFFSYNLLLGVSDGVSTRVGSITSDINRFMPWRSAVEGIASLEAVVTELFEPSRLVDYLSTCVVFEEDHRGGIEKKIAGYHQFRAVLKARARIVARLKAPLGEGDGRGGVVWHTQGSGKSLTMLMLAGALARDPMMANPTIVVVTDRNDLDDQLLGTFAGGYALLGQAPVQAGSRVDLQRLLDRPSGGVIFTTIQKFTEGQGVISRRPNIVVLADEAHRSQYGFKRGGARWMRHALPEASFVGFTGTPLERDDKNTVHVFGEYVDIYDVRQSVEDGATKPIYYEARIIPLTVDDDVALKAASELSAAAGADASGKELADTVRIPLEALVAAPARLRRLAEFIIDHWEQRRAAMEGKAMVVTMGREIAVSLYEEIAVLRPEWHSDDDSLGFMKVVISGSTREKPPLGTFARSKSQRRQLAERFKDPSDDLRLVLVCDMWLTGFDCPPAHTMYLDKPLAGHNLMQAIARVNRVYGEKPGGLIVDTLGLADQLADALATYARAGGRGEAVQDIREAAVPALQASFEKLQAFFFGYDYTNALLAEPSSVVATYLGAADHVLGLEDGWPRLRRMVKEMAAAFALAVPRPETVAVADHLVFYQRLVAMIRKQLSEGEAASGQGGTSDIAAAVRQVIGSAVVADEAIDLFAAAGLGEARLDVLSEEFLQRVAVLEQKNLALETLRKLLNDEIRSVEKSNIVQSKKFRDVLEAAMVKYTNRAITTAEMVSRLLDLARALRESRNRGEELGLSREEAAFYDALTENTSVSEVMMNDDLKRMARELAETVKGMPKLDWTARESVQAGLRRNVRRLLARYGYPPDFADGATQLVLRQAELATINRD